MVGTDEDAHARKSVRLRWMAVLGVDGWRGAWVGALLDGRSITLLALPDVAAVLAVPDVELIGIDMPIGLSDDGPRACDVEARRRLGRAGSSVFPAPLRVVLGCADYAAACEASRRASGKALSVQAWNLVPAIRALDAALDDVPVGRLREVHPELAFRALDDRVAAPKASARGLAQRIRALEPVMDVLDALAVAPPAIPAIDALDACAAAWSARRLADGGGQCVGDGGTDSCGRPMETCW
jgi:predicted RNase H-like nuclease